MTNKIGVDVQGTLKLDTTEAQAKAAKFVEGVGRKLKIDPIDKDASNRFKQFVKDLDTAAKLTPDLVRRIRTSGQSGKSVLDVDFDRLGYSDKHLREVRRRLVDYATRSSGVPVGNEPAGASFGRRAGGAAANLAQAGLRAAGPVGNVAANSLGTGMSAGFGAGLGSLLGGLAALGISKVVSTAMEGIRKAEDSAVALDRLKRSLGDVNVSFGALKAAVRGGAQAVGITYSDAERYASTFARQGNLSGSQFRTLPAETEVGVGFSRAFGLDPSEGMGMLGQMRGLGITSSTQDSRRMALLIGETIAKSDAFAKAGEVMQALAGFAEAQTRRATVAANVGDYAGMLAGMVSAKIPGLDVAGSAALLGRVNSAVQGGGAFGEASQYFTGMVGARMGLSPIGTRILREGGFFATGDQMFGPGSAAAAMGIRGQRGSTPLGFQMLSALRQQYGSDPEMLAAATANHFGVGINEAMRLLTINPKQMGALQKYGDLSKLSAGGIANLATAVDGTAEQRAGLAREFLGRGDLKDADRKAIEGAGSDDDKLRQVLPAIVAQYDQTRTQGSDIRDSRAALENIQTNIADKLVPYMNEARMGIMKLAGVGKDAGVTTESIMRDVMNADSEGRKAQIRGKFAPALSALEKEKSGYMTGNPDDPYTDAGKIVELDQQIYKIKQEQAKLLDEENARHKKEIEQYDAAQQKRALADLNSDSSAGAPGGAGSFSGSAPAGRFSSSGSGSNGTGPLRAASGEAVDDAIKYFMGKGWSREAASGIVANMVAESQLHTDAVGDGGAAMGVGQWHADRRAAIEGKFGKPFSQMNLHEQYDAYDWELRGGDAQAGTAGRLLQGNVSAGEAAGYVTRYHERPRDVAGESARRGELAESLYRRGSSAVERGGDLPPLASAGNVSGEVNVRIELDPIAARVLKPPQAPISTTVRSQWPRH